MRRSLLVALLLAALVVCARAEKDGARFKWGKVGGLRPGRAWSALAQLQARLQGLALEQALHCTSTS